MSQWQTPVTEIVLVKCHGCKVPQEGYRIERSGRYLDIPQTFTVPKNILVIESSRQGFITSCPRKIELADGSIIDNPRAPLQTFLAEIAKTDTPLTFQDVIDRFSTTIVPSKKKHRKTNVSYQLIEETKGVARVTGMGSRGLTMNESLLFGAGSNCDQGIFATIPHINPTVQEVPSQFNLTDIHNTDLSLFRDLVRNPADLRKRSNGLYEGRYHPVDGNIGDLVLLSEILNNPSIGNGTAVIVIACKGICGRTGFRHGNHDGEFHELLASDEEIAEIKRVASAEYTGTLKQVITNDPDTDVDDDTAAAADDDKKKRGRGGKVNMHKFTMKKTKHKTRKTKSKTKKRQKMVRGNNNNKNNKNKNKNKNKKRTVSASSSAVK
jgi:hypothetical protein